MASRVSHRLLRPLLYFSAAAGIGGGILYYSYRPRHIPGSDPAAVPPRFAADGTIAPPRFPTAKSRAEQIADLRRSGNAGRAGATEDTEDTGVRSEMAVGRSQFADGVYDLLIIGGGATGTGIALDAATRGLKVAVVERDDFSSGTSSKSTKLVHGGVRYLEKAVWDLDYNQ